MFFKRRPRPQPEEEIQLPQPLDPSLYGKLVDGELPVGWLDFHRSYLSSHDALLTELAAESFAAPDEESARALHEQFLAVYDDYKNQCDERGECFVKYFADTCGGADQPHRDWLAAHNR